MYGVAAVDANLCKDGTSRWYTGTIATNAVADYICLSVEQFFGCGIAMTNMWM